MALTFSFVAGTLFAGAAFVERLQTRHGEIETATVIAKARVPGEPTCHVPRWSRDYAYNYTWKSRNPPAGMTAEFVDSENCETWRVGESSDIIRLEKDGETTYRQQSLV